MRRRRGLSGKRKQVLGGEERVETAGCEGAQESKALMKA